jgi:hypothetical protein
MSLHASDENCEKLIFFEFFVFSQGVSLGSIALNVHVAKSSFLSFDFLDGSGVDGLSGFFCQVDHNILLSYQGKFFLTMFFQ